MKKPEIPANEAERLEALLGYDVLDTEAEQVFDDLVALASHICGTPIALISLVDADRQWFKARVGLDAAQTSREVSFCGHVVADDEMLVVSDAQKDERFADNPLVTADPNVRFYAGAPLKSPDNFTLGTLCVIDNVARELSDEQRVMLERLSRQVVSQLELRRSLRKVRQADAMQRRFFEVSLSMLCTANSDGYFVELNPAWEPTLGFTLDELRARPFVDFVHPEDRQATLDEAAKLASGEHKTIGFRNRYLCKDGSYRWLQWTAAADAEQGVLLASARDITADHEHEIELEEARDEAQAANRTKSAFLANMSHELRTPLNSVIGFSNLLRRRADNLSPKHQEYLNRIADNGKHLLTLLNDILDLSKVEAGRMELKLEEFDVREELERIVGEFAAVGDNAPTISLQLPEHPCTVHGDVFRLRQIVINLLSNAVKFTPGGRVEVRLHGDPLSETAVRLEVSDDGVGIPEDRIDHVFDAFRQAEDGTARRFGGTGLGLTICRSMARLMGFELLAASVLDHGSTFALVFGAARGKSIDHRQPGATDDSRVSAAVTRGRATVLVVDDDPDARLVLAELSEELGFSTICVDSGAAGIELARKVRPALVLLDLMMPGMDGFAVLKNLRDHPATSNIPVVICSMIGKERRADLTEAIAIIDKPVESDELQTVLKQHATRRQPRVLLIAEGSDVRPLETRLRALAADVVRTQSSAEARTRLVGDAFDVVVLESLSEPGQCLQDLDTIRQGEAPRIPIVVHALEANRQALSGAPIHFLPSDGGGPGRLRVLLARLLNGEVE